MISNPWTKELSPEQAFDYANNPNKIFTEYAKRGLPSKFGPNLYERKGNWSLQCEASQGFKDLFNDIENEIIGNEHSILPMEANGVEEIFKGLDR